MGSLTPFAPDSVPANGTANERSVNRDVTTSLRSSASQVRRQGKHRPGAEGPARSFLPHNGVPRSTWFRTSRRRSTWHRPYALLLVLIDYATAALGSYTAISLYPKAAASFQQHHGVFMLVAYLFLPLAWVLSLWGHGTYDRRYLGVGTDEFKRVFRAAVTVTALTSFVVFSTSFSPSRVSVGLALSSGTAYVLITRYLARRILVVLRGHGWAVNRVLLVGSFAEACDVYTAVARAPGAGLLPVGIMLTERYSSGRDMPPPSRSLSAAM